MAIMRCSRVWCILLILQLNHVSNVRMEGKLIMRKCCSDMQQLNVRGECVDYHGFISTITEARQGHTIDVKRMRGKDFPWWMDAEIKPLSTDTLKVLPSFLRGQNDDDYIELGSKQSCNLDMAIVIHSKWTDKFNLLQNGTLVYYKETQQFNFPPTSYCADTVMQEGKNETLYVYLVCPCSQMNCIKKCCLYNNVIKIVNGRGLCDIRKYTISTVTNNNSSTIQLRSYIDNQSFAELPQHESTFACHYDKVKDMSGISVWSSVNTLLRNKDYYSFIHLENYSSGNTYCADFTFEELNKKTMPIFLLCSHNKGREIMKIFQVVCVPLSVVLFLLTLLILAVVPAVRNRKSDIVVCYIICLLVMYCVLAVNAFIKTTGVIHCYVTVFINQFSTFGSAFWMNVLIIDIACKFRDLRQKQVLSKQESKKKFLYYSLYAWGCSAILVLVTIVMEFVADDVYMKPKIHPGAGRCGVQGRTEGWIYIFGIQVILSIMNTVLLLYTVAKIVHAHCSTRILSKKNGNGLWTGKKRLIVYYNLLCLVGPTRLLSVITWHVNAVPREIHMIIKAIFELLRALAIFLFICWKRPVFEFFLRLIRSPSSKKKLKHENQTDTKL